MTYQYEIGQIREDQWYRGSEIIAQAIPNALISKLGNRFGAAFYRKLVEQECSCGYVARNKSGHILGIIIGTTDYPKARSIALKEQWSKLLICANFSLLRWAVVSWVIKGILVKVRGKEQDHMNRPPAELVAIAIRPEIRGTGLAQKLVEEMEKFMLSKGACKQYVILTEEVNTRANRFYRKMGAELIRTNLHHARRINEWHKQITVVNQDE